MVIAVKMQVGEDTLGCHPRAVSVAYGENGHSHTYSWTLTSAGGQGTCFCPRTQGSLCPCWLTWKMVLMLWQDWNPPPHHTQGAVLSLVKGRQPGVQECGGKSV